MKKYKSTIILLFIFSINAVFAQLSDDNWNYLLIREDAVMPSMTLDYEASLADLTLFLEENKVKKVNYLTALQDNYNYTHITSLKSLNEIGSGLESFIRGDDESAEFELIWSDFTETIEAYRYYVVKYLPELSHVPDGKVWLEEAPYRRWNYYYFEPGREQDVNEILMAWKNLYERKGVKNGYRVFKGVIGLEQPVILFTTWAEDPLDYQQNLQETIKLLGEEGSVLWMAMLDLVRDVETVEGWYLPQFSYLPEK